MNVKKTSLVCALFFMTLLFSFAVKATVIEENKMEKALAGAGVEDLVVLDIDSTILETAQTLGSDAWFYITRDKLLADGMSKEEATKKVFQQWQKIQRVTSVKPVEASTPALIKKLQDGGIKVVALTARFQLADITPNQLDSIGVDLGRNTISSKDFDVNSKGGQAKYRNGVIYCGGLKADKGVILNDVLKKVKLNPKRIVFVDDKKNNAESVDTAQMAVGRECRCVRYGAADISYKEYNQKTADVELQYFEKILSDDAAKAILKSQK